MEMYTWRDMYSVGDYCYINMKTELLQSYHLKQDKKKQEKSLANPVETIYIYSDFALPTRMK